MSSKTWQPHPVRGTLLKDLGTQTFHSQMGDLNRHCTKHNLGDVTISSFSPLRRERASQTLARYPPQILLPKVTKARDDGLQETHVSLLLIFTQPEKCSGMVLTGLQDLFHFKCSLAYKAEQCCCVSRFHWISTRNMPLFLPQKRPWGQN